MKLMLLSVGALLCGIEFVFLYRNEPEALTAVRYLHYYLRKSIKF